MDVIELTTDQFSYNKDTRTFATEMSMLRLFFEPQYISLRNPESGIAKLFALTGRDMDASNEDVQGYHYTTHCDAQVSPALHILLIND